MAAARYADRTDVTADRSRSELERLLIAHGATGFVYGWDETASETRIMFRMADRMIRLSIPRVDPDSAEFTRTPTGRKRTRAAAADTARAEERRRWRSLLLATKARLVAVADGIETLEAAFLADVVLPDGRTVGEWLAPQLDTAYATRQMPALLPGTGA